MDGVKKLFMFLAVAALFTSAMTSVMPVYADDHKKDKKTKTLESECAKKKPTNFDGLFCIAIFNLQTTIDSFFDIFVELEDTANQSCPAGQAAVGTGIHGELLCSPILGEQSCPPGKVMTGIDSAGNVVCDDLPLVEACANECSGNGQCVGGNVCVCENGYSGVDCSIPPEPTCPSDCSNNGVCLGDGMCQCDSGFGGDDCSIPVPSCDRGETLCSDLCVNLETDSNNCGMCGTACASGDVCTNGICAPAIVDADFDGWDSSLDCNDNNASVNPGASEICDNIDNDCDGQVDQGNPGGGAFCSTGLQGVCSAGALQCTSGSLQCQQTTMASPEIADGLDNDCDGAVDEGLFITNGLYGVSPTVVYSCQDTFIGNDVVSLNIDQMNLFDDPTTDDLLDINGMNGINNALSGSRTLTGFEATGVVSGDCTETYEVVAVATGPDTFEAVLTLTFTGSQCSFTTCTDQSFSFVGALP